MVCIAELLLPEDRMTWFCSHRLLVAILRIQQSSFVLQTSERAVLEADEALLRLEPSERTVQVIEEVSHK